MPSDPEESTRLCCVPEHALTGSVAREELQTKLEAPLAPDWNREAGSNPISSIGAAELPPPPKYGRCPPLHRPLWMQHLQLTPPPTTCTNAAPLQDIHQTYGEVSGLTSHARSYK